MGDIQSDGRMPVTVIMADQQPVMQPEGFRVCPLGIQFYATRKFPEFKRLQFRIALPGNRKKSREIVCSGVVVHCKPIYNASSYRVWIKFLDLPEAQRGRIECMAKSGKYLCPHCENF